MPLNRMRPWWSFVVATLVVECLLPFTIQAVKIEVQLERCLAFDNKRGYCKTQEQCPDAERLKLLTGSCSESTLYCCPISNANDQMIMTKHLTECDRNRGYCVKKGSCNVPPMRLRIDKCSSNEDDCCPKSAFPETTTKKPAVQRILETDTLKLRTSTIAPNSNTIWITFNPKQHYPNLGKPEETLHPSSVSTLKDEFSPESFSYQECGRQNHNGVVDRTLNEEFRAEYGEFPWMVALFQLPKIRYCCNGALIDERMILTTAQCIDRCGGQAANIVARFGEWNMSSNAEMPIPRVEVGVKKFYKHPKYLSSSLINNIALLKLNDAIEYGPTVQPVCLPSPNYTLRGADIIIVTGWGKKMKENSTTTQILKRMDLIRKESSICQAQFRKSGITEFSLDNGLVCVTTNGEDVERPCDGDAGAPAVVEMPGSNNRFYLHSLVSFGHTCDQKQKRLTMLTKVVDFLDWIDGIMGKNNKGKKYG